MYSRINLAKQTLEESSKRIDELIVEIDRLGKEVDELMERIVKYGKER